VFYINIEAGNSGAQECSTDVDYFINSSDATIGLSLEPRPIKAIKPCLAFVSPFNSAIRAHSLFMVYHGDAVYHDQSPLTVVDPRSAIAHEGGGALYTCDLVPKYWNMICESSNPTEFIIQHNVVCYSSPESSDMSPPLFSATYKFRYMPEKVHSPQPSFTTVNSDISTFQESDVTNVREYSGLGCFNTGEISEISSSYDMDNKNWQDCLTFDTLSLTEQRGYASLPATPGCQWNDYRRPSIGGSSSSSSSPTTSTFPPHSQFYPSHHM